MIDIMQLPCVPEDACGIDGHCWTHSEEDTTMACETGCSFFEDSLYCVSCGNPHEKRMESERRKMALRGLVELWKKRHAANPDATVDCLTALSALEEALKRADVL